MTELPDRPVLPPIPAPGAGAAQSSTRRPEALRQALRRRVTNPRSAWLPAIRVTPALRDKVTADAEAAGLSLGAFVRLRLDGSPGPRSRRNPGPDAVLLARVLAELGKSGSNLNQIAHQLNIDETADTPELGDALREHRIAVATLMRALGV
jgi:Mobilization protein NikA